MVKTLKRRRLEAKTDHASRLALLKSGKPRLVIRKTNRYVIVQLIQSDIAQDKILLGVNSKDLLSKGWPKDKSGSLKSKSAAYLTGFMIGKEIKGKYPEVISDTGMQRNIKKSRIYSVIKGLVDAGVKIPHDAKVLPDIKEIENKNTAVFFNKVKEKI